MEEIEKKIKGVIVDDMDLDVMEKFFVQPEEFEALENKDILAALPLIELRNNVIYPHMVLPITVGRPRTRILIEELPVDNAYVALAAQKDPSIDDPLMEDLYHVGSLGRVMSIFPGERGIEILVKSIGRIRIVDVVKSAPYRVVSAESDPLDPYCISPEFLREQVKVILEHTSSVMSHPTVKSWVNDFPMDKTDIYIEHIVNNLATLTLDSVADKQKLLEERSLETRVLGLLSMLNISVQDAKIIKEIKDKTQRELEKQQREFILHQQIKTIQEELGEGSVDDEVDKLRKKAAALSLTPAVREAFEREVNRLDQMNPMAPDFSLQLAYLQLFTDLPWGTYSTDNHDLVHAQECLDEHHFGLEKVKERILEYLAVLKLKDDLKAPIICLHGPPGVGKTSLGKSVAKALGRKYARISLGGVHDESEIRGHRRTYIGAMPGRIIQNLRKVKTSNPVFILDEIDKITASMQGDPASALLEVLDPEQNNTFYDNYLEVEYDLSNVLFITTANNIGAISPALRDRMELIQITGYILEEKVSIARKHLIPNQLKAHGVKKSQFKISARNIERVIEDYTRESGVRELDQMIAKLIRQQAKRIALEEEYNVSMTVKDIQERLGPPRYLDDHYKERQDKGVAVGLAWTEFGGSIIYVESLLVIGKGNVSMTGNLGNVMKESATIAQQIIQNRAKKYGIPAEKFQKHNVHIHVPEGATPKDGPSAGVTMLTSLLSTYTGVRPTPGVAMTGEITLTGKVLPVGGIKEKILAAKRANVKKVLLPKENLRDITDIKPEYIENLEFEYISTIDDLIKIMFPKL